MRRVVVTGMGAITPLGLNVKEYFDNIKVGNHGFTTISADELGFKRHVMNQSAKKIMISDASKVNNKADIAPYAFCKFNEFDEFITNHLTAEQYDVVKTVKKVTQV